MIDEASVPLQPHTFHRADWSKLSAQLKGYYDALTKSYETDNEEFFGRVWLIAERAGKAN